MVVLVKWNFNLFVNDGKPQTLEDTINSITAYDKVSVQVAKGAKLDVALQPSSVDNVVLLCITSDYYPQTSAETLTYTPAAVTDSSTTPPTTSTPPTLNLENAHILIGNSLVKLLGSDTALTKLTFANNTIQDVVNIDIAVGRKA